MCVGGGSKHAGPTEGAGLRFWRHLEVHAAVKVLLDVLHQDQGGAGVRLQGDAQGDGLGGVLDVGAQGLLLPPLQPRAHSHRKLPGEEENKELMLPTVGAFPQPSPWRRPLRALAAKGARSLGGSSWVKGQLRAQTGHQFQIPQSATIIHHLLEATLPVR